MEQLSYLQAVLGRSGELLATSERGDSDEHMKRKERGYEQATHQTLNKSNSASETAYNKNKSQE